MIRAVLFDLDDTLFDHMHGSRCGLTQLYQQHRCLHQKSQAELDHLHKELLETLHSEVLQGRRSLESARRERFRQLFALYDEALDDAQADCVAESYRAAFQANRQLIPGARLLLERLHKQVQICIITNNMLAEQRAKLAHLRIDHLIDLLVTSEEVGVAKPDPAIFEVALQRLSCKPTETVMVGDSWSADILGATRLGLRTIWLNRMAVAAPDPALAVEIRAFEPVEKVAELILDRSSSDGPL